MEQLNTWNGFKVRLKNLTNKGLLPQFKGIDIIRQIPLFEVHSHPFYIDYAHECYTKMGRINIHKWKFAMAHSSRGYLNHSDYYAKDSYKLNDFIVSAATMKSNHHYYHYNYLANQDILEMDHIVELGGGCGDMAMFIRNLGYQGKYTIIDLPEVLPIQNYALDGYNIELTSQAVKSNSNKILFISTWGISECPISWRNEVLDTLQPTNWLIAYQSRFEDIDNEEYFNGLSGVRYDFPAISWDGGSKYILK